MLLPVRNALPDLDDCLASISRQTLPDFEVVAVNDGSTDGSAQTLRQAATRDARLRVLDNPGRGLVDALNAGLRACRGKLIARMDADDAMHPERLAEQVKTMQNERDLVVLGSQVELIESAVTGAGFRDYVRWQNLCLTPQQIADRRYVESPFAHPSVMLRRDVVLSIGGYRAGAFPEDYDLWLRLAAGGHPMRKLERVLLSWRDHPQRLSRTDPRCDRAAFDQLRAHYLARDPRVMAARDRLVIWGAGRKTRARCAHLFKHGFAPVLWIDIDPKKIGNIVQGARVVAPDHLSTLAAPFVLSYVANHGARDEIAAQLTSHGLAEGRDWLAVG